MFDTFTPADLAGLDAAALKAIILAQGETHQAQQESHRAEIERLKLLIAKLQRLLFGTKSEKVLRQVEQLELQLEELEVAAKPIPAKPFRRPLPEHLPREVHTHVPRAGCLPGVRRSAARPG